MGFQVWFRPPPVLTARASPPSDDGYESIVIGACQVLAGTDCEFGVTGFGREAWPVDVGYDLSTFVEQLPEARTRVARGEPAEIDFYGQGVERLLRFENCGDLMLVLCTSRTSWMPMPTEEPMTRTELVRMLDEAASGFAGSLARMWPRVSCVEAACAVLQPGGVRE